MSVSCPRPGSPSRERITAPVEIVGIRLCCSSVRSSSAVRGRSARVLLTTWGTRSIRKGAVCSMRSGVAGSARCAYIDGAVGGKLKGCPARGVMRASPKAGGLSMGVNCTKPLTGRSKPKAVSGKATPLLLYEGGPCGGAACERPLAGELVGDVPVTGRNTPAPSRALMSTPPRVTAAPGCLTKG